MSRCGGRPHTGTMPSVMPTRWLLAAALGGALALALAVSLGARGGLHGLHVQEVADGVLTAVPSGNAIEAAHLVAALAEAHGDGVPERARRTGDEDSRKRHRS